MRIDSHQHFWKYNTIKHSWIDESMKKLQRDFLPQDLKLILTKNSIDGCVAVQADQSEEETEFLLKCAKENPFIKGVVGWVDLCAANIEERLIYFSTYKKLSGVRHIVQGEPTDFMLRNDFRFGISKLQQFELTYDLLVFPPQLPEAIELIQKFPKQPFVLDHMAKPYIKKGKIEIWKKNIRLLAQFPNVNCKISGMFTEADWENWSEHDFIPYLDVVFDSFGVDRVLFGSDWPVCLLVTEYPKQLIIIEEYIANFSDEDKAKIMGKNAVQFYNLKC